MIGLTSEQQAVQALAREFASTRVTPNADAWNDAHEIPREIIQEMADLGFLGVMVPEEYGGSGLDATCLALIVEELARADAGASITVAVQNGLTCAPIMLAGTDEQKAQWLPALAAGDLIGAYALTEPDVGSDTANLRTAAVADKDGWRLTGSKMWITNGGIADVFVVFARTGQAGPRGISAFVTRTGDGLTVGPEIPKMGLHSSSTVPLSFDGLRVERDALLGKEGGGLRVALATLDAGRITVAAQACGIAAHAVDVATRYARERVAFGGPIARFQGVQFPIADLSAKVDAARLLTLHAAALRDAGEPHGVAGAKAKLFASRVAVEAADVAVQTLGGYGYSAEFPAERLYRDAKITELYEGTSEIQRLVIARDIWGDDARS